MKILKNFHANFMVRYDVFFLRFRDCPRNIVIFKREYNYVYDKKK